MESSDVEAIRQVIQRAYIEGIHSRQDIRLVLEGFHAGFAMLVRRNESIARITVEQWLEMIDAMKGQDPGLWGSQTTCRFEMIDVAGDAAVAKLQVFKGARHYSTDYMLLYRFSQGWRIVSKVFALPGPQ